MSFKPDLPARLTISADLARVEASLKQPFIEKWKLDDEKVQTLLGKVGYISFNGFNSNSSEAGSETEEYFIPGSVLGSDEIGVRDFLRSDKKDSYIFDVSLFKNGSALSLDGPEPNSSEYGGGYAVYVAPDMPPTAIKTGLIEENSLGTSVDDISKISDLYGRKALHELSDEDCSELVRVLAMARIDEDMLQDLFEEWLDS